VPKLEIRVAKAAPPSTLVERDDVVLGAASLGLSLPIDPGQHRIVAKAEGYAPREYPLEIREGESSKLEVEPGATIQNQTEATVPSAPPPTAFSGENPPIHGSSAKRTWGFVGLGIGAAGLIVGGTAGVLAIGKKHTVDDDCFRDAGGQHVCRTSAGVDAVEAGRTLSTVANIGVAVGLVGVAAGAYLLISSGGESTTSAFFRVAPGGATTGVAHSF
jgi:hypothetical protein